MGYRDDLGEEFINGQLIKKYAAGTKHNRIAGKIFHIFETYLTGKAAAALGSRYDLYLTDRDRFIPDGMIVCDQRKIKEDGIHGAPDLVVEILYPTTAFRDRGYKKDVYETCGVPEYWIVDPENRAIEVYLIQNGKYTLDNLYILYPDYMVEKMTDKEKSVLETKFKCHLYDDLFIDLERIFDTLF